MKTKILGFLLLFTIAPIFAEEITIFIGDAYHYNEILSGMSETQFAIKYDTEDKIYYFFSSNIMDKGWIKLSEEQLNTLRNTLKKYIDWKKPLLKNKLN